MSGVQPQNKAFLQALMVEIRRVECGWPLSYLTILLPQSSLYSVTKETENIKHRILDVVSLLLLY